MLAPKFDSALVHRLADQLEAVLAFADRLTGLRLPLVSITTGLTSDQILDQLDAVRDYVETARSLELALIAKIEISRQHAERLSRHDRDLRGLAAMFAAATRPLSEAAIATGDRTMEIFHQADQVLPYLKARRVVPSSLASLDDLPVLAITPEFHLCALVRLGSLIELSDSMLQVLDLNYGLYEPDTDLLADDLDTAPELTSAAMEAVPDNGSGQARSKIDSAIVSAGRVEGAPAQQEFQNASGSFAPETAWVDTALEVDAAGHADAIPAETPLAYQPDAENPDLAATAYEPEQAATSATDDAADVHLAAPGAALIADEPDYHPEGLSLRERLDASLGDASEAVSETLAIVEQELEDRTDDQGDDLAEDGEYHAYEPEAASPIQLDAGVGAIESASLDVEAETQADARDHDVTDPGAIAEENIEPAAISPAADEPASAGDVAQSVAHPAPDTIVSPQAGGELADDHGNHSASLLSRLTTGTDDPFAAEEKAEEDAATPAPISGEVDPAVNAAREETTAHTPALPEIVADIADNADAEQEAEADREARAQGGGKIISLTLVNPHAKRKSRKRD